MATLDMEGPYVLIPDKIDEVIPQKVTGNFAVGYISESDFIVLYIGRSDDDLNAAIKDWVFRKSDCIFFKFKVMKTAKEAFFKECTNYHDFQGSTNLKNERHPWRNEGTDWKCPHCNIYK
jgi:hypothetical protein